MESKIIAVKRHYRILEKNNNGYNPKTYFIQYTDLEDEKEPDNETRYWLPYRGTWCNDGINGIIFNSLNGALNRINLLLEGTEIYIVDNKDNVAEIRNQNKKKSE